MTGPKELWVGMEAAFNGRESERANDINYSIPLQTTHSGLVKCDKWDIFETILEKLQQVHYPSAKAAIEKLELEECSNSVVESSVAAHLRLGKGEN